MTRKARATKGIVNKQKIKLFRSDDLLSGRVGRQGIGAQ